MEVPLLLYLRAWFLEKYIIHPRMIGMVTSEWVTLPAAFLSASTTVMLPNSGRALLVVVLTWTIVITLVSLARKYCRAQLAWPDMLILYEICHGDTDRLGWLTMRMIPLATTYEARERLRSAFQAHFELEMDCT